MNDYYPANFQRKEFPKLTIKLSLLFFLLFMAYGFLNANDLDLPIARNIDPIQIEFFELADHADCDVPDNDLCANAQQLINGLEGTNYCATGALEFCGLDLFTSHDVYYSYTNNTGNTIDLQVTISGSTVVTGTAASDVSVAILSACPNNKFFGTEYKCNILGSQFTIECIRAGETEGLVIGSPNGAEGDFLINYFELGGKPSNNECANPEPINYTPCVWKTINGSNDNACPERFAAGTCNFDEAAVVWFSFVATPDATTVDFGNLTGTDAFMGLFYHGDNCDSLTEATSGSACIQGNSGPFVINGGETYLIAYAKSTPGPFSFEINIREQPENDDPCPSHFLGANNLGAQSGAHSGTTCCASPDFPNAECSAATETNTVWYIFDPRTDSEGVEINVTGGTISGPVTVEVFAGDPNMGCTGTLSGFQAVSCTALPANLNLVPCWKDGDILYIKVASTNANCGTFSILVSDSGPSCDNGGRTCEDAPFVFSLVTDPNYANIYPQCASLCLEMACPDPTAPPGCDFSQSPTVWITLETDDIPSQLVTSVTPAGSWDPLWTVYFGDCDNLTPIANNLGTDCNFDVATTPIQSDATGTITTYYVAITADPNGPPIDDPNFEFCAYTRIEVLTCIGTDYGCQENDPDTEVEVLWREFDGPLEGPFCPGEEVRIKIHFFYDAAESQVDWFHGFIPDFGPGWDILNFDWEAELPIATGPSGGPGSFHEEGTECESELHRSFPHLCTYRDELGILRLVHTECDDDITKCDEYGMGDKDVLPNGFFWLSNGSNAGCVSGSCRPRQRWGVGSKTSTVDWEFNIKVREFDNETECLQNRDLQIGFLPFSDDGAGCWDDATPCRLDKKQFGPKWLTECTTPSEVIVEAPADEICSGSALALNLYTADGSASIIEITYEDNPNVTGMNNHSFPNGSGIINDKLTIVDPETCIPEAVNYYVHSIIPGLLCHGTIEKIDIVVIPSPQIIQSEIPVICHNYSAVLDISDSVYGCSEHAGSYSYSWTGPYGMAGDDQFIIVSDSMEPGIYEYNVEIHLEQACSNIQIFSVEVFAIDTSVTKYGNTLSSNQADGIYQWLNCNAEMAHIFGETGQSFTPAINGSYAVRIEKNGCIDTSKCHVVILTGINDLSFGREFIIYPNPGDNKVTIDLKEIYSQIAINVYNSEGREIFSQQYANISTLKLDTEWVSGIYHVVITSVDRSAVLPFVRR